MTVSSPDRRYFKDPYGLRPNWRFALRWPRTYVRLRARGRRRP